MTGDDAANILTVVQAGWSWQMSQMTQDVWLHNLERWDDVEAAEIAVIELVGQLTHRPNLGEIRTHYEAVSRRLQHERPKIAPEVRPVLPAGRLVITSDPDSAWSAEGARWAVGLREGRVRDGVLHEGEDWTPSLREEDVVAAEDIARASYMELGGNPKSRSRAVLKKLHELIDRKQTSEPEAVDA